jgi:phosphate-selective porin
MSRVLVALLLLMPALAPAQEEDKKYQELLARQRQLEERLRAQDALLRQLQSAVALAPLPPPSSEKTLAVRPEAASSSDPELLAPLAGYSEKNFFLRDRHSWFVLVPKGRINIDWYNFLNRPALPVGVSANSAADQRPRDTLFIRRARIGLAGTIARHIDFRVEAEFANLATPGQYATVTDASIVINYSPYVQFEAGQFYAPFTLENPTSENYTDFMEKAAAVRFVVPTAREIGGMLQGEAPRKAGRYWVGVFNGDGQNFKNLDNKPAVIGRAFVAPVAIWKRHPRWTEDLWLGGSFWWQNSTNLGGVGPASTSGTTSGDLSPVSTQGGINLFNSNYGNGVDLAKNAIRSHLAPNGTTVKWALELNVPLLSRYGLRSEYMHQSIHVGEYNDLNLAGNLTRNYNANGLLEGWAAYVEAYAWFGGDVHVDKPGLYQVPHWNGYIPPPPPRWAVMLAARYEHIELGVSGLPQITDSMGNLVNDTALGHYSLDVFELGANLWVTRHSRFMANYFLNYLDGNATNVTKNIYFNGHYDHELLFRLAVSL